MKITDRLPGAPAGNELQLGKLTRSQEPFVKSAENSFGADIKKFLSDVNQTQLKAEDITTDLINGKSKNIHEAVIAMEKAQLSLQFTLQTRNKVIEAYQEIMRMQI